MSEVSNISSKRVAKNAAFMYVRMLLLMLLSFYTSRMVLQQLGVVDFGIYNLVGSIVAMFNSVRVLFSQSTQRFLNYEMGKHSGRESIVFNMSNLLNIFIAIVFVALVEIVGVIFFKYYAVLPADRLSAAKIVFQLSLCTAVVAIFTTPYEAVVIAREKFNFYAYLSIAEGLMKLAVVLVLSWLACDKLILYGLLVLLVSVIVRYVYLIYCKYHYPESRYHFLWDTELFKKMASFAGWNFFGNMAYQMTQNGLNMLLNAFGGTVLNAARGVAFQVSDATKQFLNGVTTAVTPHGIKAYAAGNSQHFYNVVFFSSKVLFYVQLMLSIPLIFLTPWILQVWLGIVPEYAVSFVRLMLIISLVRSVHGPLDMVFKAAGRLKQYQLTECFILLLPLLMAYIWLTHSVAYSAVFIFCIVSELLNLLAILVLASKLFQFPGRKYMLSVLLPITCVAIFAGLLFLLIGVQDSIILKGAITIISMLISSAFWWIWILAAQEREQIRNIIAQRIK